MPATMARLGATTFSSRRSTEFLRNDRKMAWPSSRPWRRRSRKHSVMARSHARVDYRPSGREAAASRDGDAMRAGALFRAECHGCERERPIRTLGKEGQASSVAAPVFGGPAETKKARSVVALSRVPREGRGPPVSPLTVSPRVREADASRGGSPASCPDAHRPTRGHRHVRVWARLQISSRASRFKRFVKRSRRAALKPRGGRARAHVDVTQKRNTATATTQVQRPDGSPSAAAAIEVLSIIRLLCS
jgi:hypothetical protein